MRWRRQATRRGATSPGGVPPGYYHPFGRVPNAFVHMGATLAIAQAIVFGIYWAVFPAMPEVELAGAGLFLMLLVVATISLGAIWLAWRALMSWRDRQPKALGRLLLVGLLLLPLGGVDRTALLFTLAGMFLLTAVLLARHRVIEYERTRHVTDAGSS